MCGILGYIGNSEFSETIVNSTLNLMKSRGPNSQDFFKTKISHKHLFFLHSRLSIIDLDQRSNQPMRKGDCTIIFNGEIYNYLEIRNKLTKSGHHFLTNSDTEVILEAYKEFGENCVNLFEGMWSFSIYDKKLWDYLGSELDTSTKLLKLANHKILLNFVIDRASRNDKVRNVISGMLANEVPRTELSNPLFYLKTLFS